MARRIMSKILAIFFATFIVGTTATEIPFDRQDECAACGAGVSSILDIVKKSADDIKIDVSTALCLVPVVHDNVEMCVGVADDLTDLILNYQIQYGCDFSNKLPDATTVGDFCNARFHTLKKGCYFDVIKNFLNDAEVQGSLAWDLRDNTYQWTLDQLEAAVPVVIEALFNSIYTNEVVFCPRERDEDCGACQTGVLKIVDAVKEYQKDIKASVSKNVCGDDADCSSTAEFLVDDLLANSGFSTYGLKIQDACQMDPQNCDGSRDCFINVLSDFVNDAELRMGVSDLLKQEMSWSEAKAFKFVNQVYDMFFGAIFMNEVPFCL